jgi:hypothetical protein
MTLRPRLRARLAGGLYLLSGVFAGFYLYVASKLLVRGDPTATAARVLESEGLFRVALGADLVGISLVIASVLVLSRLFEPVSRDLTLQMVAFILMGSAIQALNSIVDLVGLSFMKGGTALASLTPFQSQAIGYTFLRAHGITYNVALVFFGIYTLVVAALVLRSRFLPRVLGLLMVLDGLGYLTAGLAVIVAPALALRLYPFVPMGTAFLCELPFMLWLIVRGVDEARWREQAGAPASL